MRFPIIGMRQLACSRRPWRPRPRWRDPNRPQPSQNPKPPPQTPENNALQTSQPGREGPVTTRQILFRAGETITFLGYITDGDPDPAVLDMLVEQATSG